MDKIKISRAVVSVSDKEGVADFAKGLAEMGVEMISTGGTAKALKEAGLEVKDVAELTQYPEMMDGRVKTLHPRVHGGILARRDNPNDLKEMEANGIKPIDLVCVNLYPFEQTVAKQGVTLDEAIENIDIGGPCMVRASAKNNKYVAIVTSPSDYAAILEEMKDNDGALSLKTRQSLALKAFQHTAGYDKAISEYLGGAFG